VCGGLARYLNADATLIRVLFVVLALLGGPGIVIYLLM
jgi:phage shock protein C